MNYQNTVNKDLQFKLEVLSRLGKQYCLEPAEYDCYTWMNIYKKVTRKFLFFYYTTKKHVGKINYNHHICISYTDFDLCQRLKGLDVELNDYIGGICQPSGF